MDRGYLIDSGKFMQREGTMSGFSEYTRYDGLGLAELVRKKEVKPVELVEEAIGRIYEIFVVVPDGVGGLQIAQGGTFSYYEFPWPINDRLTNEKWRAMVTAGEQPDQPEWTEMFIAE